MSNLEILDGKKRDLIKEVIEASVFVAYDGALPELFDDRIVERLGKLDSKLNRDSVLSPQLVRKLIKPVYWFLSSRNAISANGEDFSVLEYYQSGMPNVLNIIRISPVFRKHFNPINLNGNFEKILDAVCNLYGGTIEGRFRKYSERQRSFSKYSKRQK